MTTTSPWAPRKSISRWKRAGFLGTLCLILFWNCPLLAFDAFGGKAASKPRAGKVQVTAFPESDKVKQGDPVVFHVVVTLAKGWHIYTLQAKEDPTLSTTISLEGISLQPQEAWQESPPQMLNDRVLQRMIKVHSQRAEFSRLYSVPADLKPGAYPVKGELSFRACDNKVCGMPQKVPFSTKINILPDDRA